MKYILAFENPNERLISVQIQGKGVGGPMVFCLPKWRPGRYELQRYDRNVSDVSIRYESGEPKEARRLTTHSWEINPKQGQAFTFEYTYFANQLDAGGTYYDSEGVYVNGITLFMYAKGMIDDPCTLELKVPSSYQVACGLKQEGNLLFADDFHQLVDAPFLASPNLLHHSFTVAGLLNHFWFYGPVQPDLQRLEEDVRKYTEVQLALFGECPVEEYHYFFVMRPDKFRHGVEHFNSTVIAMGPGFNFNQPEFYRSFLEICSHELFHTWNVKALRPADMYPYDYDGENYSHLHYVTEGVTTYYGDLMIWKGGTWGEAEWLQSLNGELRRFYQMGGRPFISLEKASFESWINGYNQDGTPNRRISFYTKGYLVAFLLDITIRKATQNRYSLDTVMREMYHRVALNGRGYTREDYKGIAEELSGINLDSFFKKYISGVENLEAALSEAGDYVGLELRSRAHPSSSATYFGFETTRNSEGSLTVANIYPESPALAAGLSKGDELVSLDGWKIEDNVETLLQFRKGQESIEIHFFHQGRLCSGKLPLGTGYLAYIPQFGEVLYPSAEQVANRDSWRKVLQVSEVEN